jgi:tripartite-type tricarboxylate transporter receptor subunit TctC
MKGKLHGLGLEARPSTPAEFDTWIRAEIPRWAAVVKKAGITID